MTEWVLLVLTGVLGVRGFLGGGQFIIDPSGDLVGLSTAELSGSPFSDFLLPGLVLFVVLGLAPILVVVGLTRERRWAWWGVVGVSIALIGWILIEGWVVGFGERLQIPNSCGPSLCCRSRSHARYGIATSISDEPSRPSQ